MVSVAVGLMTTRSFCLIGCIICDLSRVAGYFNNSYCTMYYFCISWMQIVKRHTTYAYFLWLIVCSVNRTSFPTMVFWVFGYGSLIWNPVFEYDEKVIGFIKDYKRCFDVGKWILCLRDVRLFKSYMALAFYFFFFLLLLLIPFLRFSLLRSYGYRWKPCKNLFLGTKWRSHLCK